MITRNKGKFEKGFYKNLLEGNKKKEVQCCSSKRIDFFKPFLNELRFRVLKQLTNRRKFSPICKGQVIISDNSAFIFRDQFNIGCRFKRFETLENMLFTERIFNKNDLVYLVAGSLEIKLKNKSKLYFIDKKFKERYIFSKPKIEYRFLKECKVLSN